MSSEESETDHRVWETWVDHGKLEAANRECLFANSSLLLLLLFTLHIIIQQCVMRNRAGVP